MVDEDCDVCEVGEVRGVAEFDEVVRLVILGSWWGF